jgi:hypothetical protein
MRTGSIPYNTASERESPEAAGKKAKSVGKGKPPRGFNVKTGKE